MDLKEKIEEVKENVAVVPEIKSSEKNSEKKPKYNIQNLKPFKPGESGNPKGRELGKRNKDTLFNLALEAYARKLLTAYNKGRKKKIAWEDFDADPEMDIFMKLVDKARTGDMRAIEKFLDHRHGTATQTIELSGPNGQAIEYQEKMKEARSRLEQFQDLWFKPLAKVKK